MESDDQRSHFLKIRLARLSIFQMIGTIERWIRWRIKTSTMQQLLQAETELMDKMREVQEGRASVVGVYKAWSAHPLQKFLFEERLRREYLLENNSEDYLGHLTKEFSDGDIRDYLIWKGDKHGTVKDWQKEKKRSLPVIKNEKEEAKTSNRGFLSVGEGVNPRGSNPTSSPKSLIQAPIKGENKAYGIRRKG